MILACCCNPPEFLESKTIRLQWPFPGFAIYDNVGGGHVTTWTTVRYLVKTNVNTDGSGLARTITTTYDPDNGSLETTTVTDPGWVGASGSVTSYTYDDTNRNTTYTVGSIVESLTSSIDFDDRLEIWRARFDAMFPLASVITPATLEFYTLPVHGGTTTITKDWDFPSASPDADRIWIRPRINNFPWDGTYQFTNYILSPSLAANEFYVDDFIGASPVTGPYQSAGDWLSGSGPFDAANPSVCLLMKTCVALPSGADCGITDFTTEADYMLGDVVVADFDYATGAYTVSGTSLTLSPGRYSFDGVHLLVNSGSVISGGGVDGLLSTGASATGLFTAVMFRTSNAGFINEIADRC